GVVGYCRQAPTAVETGFKYLILSASASSFMLLGIAFIYAHTGDLSLHNKGKKMPLHLIFLGCIKWVLFCFFLVLLLNYL
ncbi:MAG: proton-conducting transporter membrane subunit, partial [Thalassotalea sp.]|nr:proton-conducting transporter membrane subunit [Thalassotalea sp.]